VPYHSVGSVRLVSTPAEFAALRNPWNVLADAVSTTGASIFFRHEWFDAAWCWRHESAHLHLLCFYAAERLAAVLPLVFQQVSVRGFQIRELAFLTVPDTQLCDMIAAERDRMPAATAFALELARRQREWDVIRLKYLAPTSVAASTLRDALGRFGFRTRSIATSGNQFIALDSSWESYYARRSRRLKKANNLAANRVAKAGEVRIDWLQPDVDTTIAFASFLDRAISVSAKSWKTHTGNSLDNPGPGAFIRRLSELASQRGWLSIWILSVNDRPLAMEYQLVANGYVHGLRSDFDATFDEISPGTYLNRCLIERLFDHGLRRYYLGPGDNPYKLRWADHVEPLEELTAYGRSFAGRSLSAWEITLKPMAIKLRDRLRRPSSDERDDQRD